jgi:hypothetical protein
MEVIMIIVSVLAITVAAVAALTNPDIYEENKKND